MKKKVMCMLLTGMMAASMIAGCGNSGNASANAGADTNTDAPRLSVMAFNVQAKVRIRIAGTIALNPSGIHAIQSLKFITRRIRYKTIVITSPKKLPSTSPTDASLCENAVTKSVPLKKPPV